MKAFAALFLLVVAACGGEAEKPPTRPIPVAAEVIAGSDVHVEVIRPGEGPREVAEGDRLRVRYRLHRARDGKLLDSSDSRGRPFVATLKQPDVIEGWVRGLVGMRVGEVRRLQVPPEFGYGADGEFGDDVLIFDVEMLGWLGGGE